MTKRLNDKKKAVQGITTKVFHALNTGKEAPEGRNTGRMIHSKRASVTVLADSSFLWQGRNFEDERSHNKNY